MEDKNMRQMIANFKAIMADKRERKEFVGSFACVIVTLAVLYITIVIIH